MIFLCDVCTRFEILHIGSHLHNFIQDCAILKYCINLNFCKNPWGKLYVYYIKTNICKKGIMGNMNCQLKRIISLQQHLKKGKEPCYLTMLLIRHPQIIIYLLHLCHVVNKYCLNNYEK